MALQDTVLNTLLDEKGRVLVPEDQWKTFVQDVERYDGAVSAVTNRRTKSTNNKIPIYRNGQGEWQTVGQLQTHQATTVEFGKKSADIIKSKATLVIDEEAEEDTVEDVLDIALADLLAGYGPHASSLVLNYKNGAPITGSVDDEHRYTRGLTDADEHEIELSADPGDVEDDTLFLQMVEAKRLIRRSGDRFPLVAILHPDWESIVERASFASEGNARLYNSFSDASAGVRFVFDSNLSSPIDQTDDGNITGVVLDPRAYVHLIRRDLHLKDTREASVNIGGVMTSIYDIDGYAVTGIARSGGNILDDRLIVPLRFAA